MKDTIDKYVRDLDGMLTEIRDLKEDLFESEEMVIFYTGVIYKYLDLYGILIKDEKKGELDAIAYLDPAAKNKINIEFELYSSNFVKHKHDPNKCDLIICWKHDWKKCPDNIDMMELEYFWELAKTSNIPY